MKTHKKTSVLILLSLLTIGLLAGFTARSAGNHFSHPENAASDSISSLIALSDFWDMYYDYGYNIDILSEQRNKPGPRIRSISVYRLSSSSKDEMLQDSILLSREGKPVVRISPYESGPSYTYYFYDDRGNRYLDINISSSKYDTLYTLRQFDRYHHAVKAIQYNITRKELQYLTVIEMNALSDTLVQLKLLRFDSDVDHRKVLPFEGRDMLVSRSGDSLLSVHTDRTVFSDTSYNSSYTDLYRIENNRLVYNKMKCQTLYNQQGDWIEKKSNDFDICRKFSYYASAEPEITVGLAVNASVVGFLSSQMDSLPPLAWKNYRGDQDSLNARELMYEEGTYGDSITLTEGHSLDEFMPGLWYTVSVGSGNITGFDSICYAVGYNTPVKSNDDDNMRCLAIYEHRNGMFRLIKQSFGALDPFYDADNDLLFDGFDETNYSISIDSGDIVVNYEYMRGEATSEYAFEGGKWLLVYYSSSHRTCCQAESSSYDYRTKTYSYSLYNMGDYEEENSDMPRDTTITEIQDRPVIYMDDLTDSSTELYDSSGGEVE
jgi:hypothetical protein